jgi:polyphosphate glucokinase
LKILVIDIGGTNVKIQMTGQTDVLKIPSGPTLTAKQMADEVLRASRDWDYEAISIGYPGPVVDGKPVKDPRNLAPGWIDFDYAAALRQPIKLINDAAMQAVGSYDGGRMLFLGLGTGLGSAMVVGTMVMPLELAHLPYRKGRTFEDYLGLRGIDRLGKKKWRKAVCDVSDRLRAALIADYVVLGGGNARMVKELPEAARLGANSNAFLGGYRLWQENISVASSSEQLPGHAGDTK